MVYNASKAMEIEISQLIDVLAADAVMLGKIQMYNEAMVPEQEARVRAKFKDIQSKIDELVCEIRGEYIG